MPFINTQSGIDWYYDCCGEGEVLMFLHGWGMDQRLWRQQKKFFGEKYKVMAVDLPGHGKSTWRKVTLEMMAKDLIDVCAYCDIASLHLIGSSLGGMLALKFYDLCPDRVNSLVMVGSMPKFSKSDDYPYGLDIRHMRKLGGQVLTAYPAIVNIFFRSLFSREERKSRRYQWIQRFRNADTEAKPVSAALLEYLDILEHEDLRDVLKKVDRPIQFINGAEDAICHADVIALLKELAPQSRFDIFNKCGHFPFLTRPYEFNKVLESFLKEE